VPLWLGKPVEITCTNKTASLASVRDQGIGIRVEDQERIFERLRTRQRLSMKEQASAWGFFLSETNC